MTQTVAVSMGLVPVETAVQNRLAIEAALAQGEALLPDGDLLVDRAITLPSGGRLVGHGLTTIRQPFTTNVFPANCIVRTVPTWPVDYLNPATFQGKIATVSSPANFVEGGYCYSHHRGVYDGQPQNCRLHRIDKVQSNKVQLDTPPHSSAQYLNAVRGGVRAPLISRGSITLPRTTFTAPVGSYCLVTDGMTCGDEPHGEIRRVVECRDNFVRFDAPLVMELDPNTAVICPLEPIADASLGDLYLQTDRPEQSATWLGWTVNLGVEHVRATQGFGVTCSSLFQAISCHGSDCGISNSTQCAIQRGQYKRLWCESGSEQVEFRDLVVADTPNDGNAFAGGSGSKFCALRRAEIVRCGQNLIGWDGPGLTIEDVLVHSSVAQNNAFITSDGGRMAHCMTDGAKWVLKGSGWQIVNTPGTVLVPNEADASAVAEPVR